MDGLTVSSEQGDGGASSASTTSTADTVDVVFRVVRVVVVEHVSNALDVFRRSKVSTYMPYVTVSDEEQ